MKNVGAKHLELFKLQAHLFVGVFSVLPQSTISLTIAGGVISTDQAGIIPGRVVIFASRQNY